MAHSEEDEWEYEYDETETEDFYIPVDVANVPELQAHVNAPSQRLGHPWLLKTKLRAFYANRKGADNIQNLENIQEGQEPAPMGEIQAIGLHTSNPLIMYNSQLLSCQWVSAMGTDMLFAKPDLETGEEKKPLRALPEVDLISLSSARLVARVGRLRPKDELFEAMSEEPQTEAPMDNSSPTRGTASETMNEQDGRHDARPASSSFLAKLNAAKAKRGESSRLVLTKTVNGPRLVAEGAEVQLSSDSEEAEDAIMTGT